MKFTLTQEKVPGFIKLCQEILQNESATLWKITSLIGSLCLAEKAVLPALFQVGYLPEQQIQVSRLRCPYQTLMHLNSNSMEELKR